MTNEVNRTVYDYHWGDFDGLRCALESLNLSNIQDDNDINLDRIKWKDTFLFAVAKYTPTNKIKGKSTQPWINGEIIHILWKKEAVCAKLKKSSLCQPTQKYLELTANYKTGEAK